MTLLVVSMTSDRSEANIPGRGTGAIYIKTLPLRRGQQLEHKVGNKKPGFG